MTTTQLSQVKSLHTRCKAPLCGLFKDLTHHRDERTDSDKNICVLPNVTPSFGPSQVKESATSAMGSAHKIRNISHNFHTAPPFQDKEKLWGCSLEQSKVRRSSKRYGTVGTRLSGI